MPGTEQRRGRRGGLRPVFTDVTQTWDAPAPHADQVLAFQESGYDVLGLVTLDVSPGGYEAVAAGYAPDVREEVLAHFPEPSTILRSADGLVQATVAWFWTEPSLQLRTWMDDGSLVETHRRWPAVPPWPRRRAAAWRHATVEGEMTRQAAEGRSIATVPDAEAHRLDKAHRAHVRAYGETYGCSPVSAPEAMEEIIPALERATLHMWRVGEVYARVANVLVVLIVLLAAGWSWAMFAAAVPWAPLWSVCGALTVLLSLNRFAVRFAYTRWWRPAYR